MQEVDALAGVCWPAGQKMQLPLPPRAANLPAGHASHVAMPPQVSLK
jgi:hypothetical protein